MFSCTPRIGISTYSFLRVRYTCQRSLTTTIRLAAEHVRIVEVGPRDGLQNEKSSISMDLKLELIKRLSETGVQDIEAGAFVSPKWVPQMANSSQILKHLLSEHATARHSIGYSFLVPNMKGFETFLSIAQGPQFKEQTGEVQITPIESPNEPPTPPPTPPEDKPAPITSTEDPNDMPSNTLGAEKASSGSSTPPRSPEISVFAAATETFSMANTNCSIAESLERFRPIMSLAKASNTRVRAYVSVALGCPYEGLDVSPARVAELSRILLEMGASEICLADTTGTGTVPRTRELLKTMQASGVATKDLAMHFHDTYGQALVNAVAALEHGIRVFDSSVGGLGGCPYSKGATGNVATEDLVYCLHSLGVQTGIDIRRIAETGKWICDKLGREYDSRAGKALLANMH